MPQDSNNTVINNVVINNKVLILTGKAGQGHISIAKSLEYWTAQWGFKPKVLDILPGYINTTYKINLKTHTHTPMFKITDNRYLSKLMVRGFNGSLEERVEALCPDYKAYGVAISTHPLLHPNFAQTNVIILPDPEIHGMYMAPPKPNHYLSFWKWDRRYELLGPIVRKGFYNERKYQSKQGLKKECGFDPNKQTAIIIAGGEWINRSQDYIDILGYSFDPNTIEFVFLCGKNDRFRQENTERYKGLNMKFLGWMDDTEISRVFRAGDFGIYFSGSQVITETGICKLPLYILDSMGAQESGFVQIVEKNGAGRSVRGSYWEKIDKLKALVPQTDRLFEKNLDKWSKYLMERPKVWEDFFTKKILANGKNV